jgi:peptidoglycan/LPS O-acetylase OafA/YrhL
MSTTHRRHDIDALRALAFALLILYHLCMFYVAGWDWHIKSPHAYEWLQLPMILVNRWRMDLIFMISGIASAFLIKPEFPGRFLASRTVRLMLPLVFGIAVIVPVQPYVQGVSNDLVAPGFVQFLADYYTGKPWPKDAFDGWYYGFTWNHLWYLAYLWIYTIALAVLARPLESRLGTKLRALFTGLRGPALLLLPILPLCLYSFTLQPLFPDNGDFIHDWYRNAVYFTVFLYGYLVARDAGFWTEATRMRWTTIACAAALFGVRMVLVAMYPGDTPAPAWIEALALVLRNLYMWSMLLAILGWGHASLNRPWCWLPWANENVYPWYILHQSLIVLFAYWLLPLHLHPLLEAACILALTVAACWSTTALVRRSRWLRPLFGLKAGARMEHAAPLLQSAPAQ